MLSASITVLYTTARALETEKWQYYLLAGIVMGLSLYTYALMYIVLPLYLLLWLGYGIRLGKIRLRELLLLLLPHFMTPLSLRTTRHCGERDLSSWQ